MKRLPLLLLLVCGLPTRGLAYIEGGSPTLGRLTKEAVHIVVLRVDRVSLERRVIVFRKVADLKGNDPQVEVKHQLADGVHPGLPHAVLDWAEPGKLAVCFHDGKVCLTCIGAAWYQCSALPAPWWTMTAGRPELAYA